MKKDNLTNITDEESKAIIEGRMKKKLSYIYSINKNEYLGCALFWEVVSAFNPINKVTVLQKMICVENHLDETIKKLGGFVK